MMKSTAPNPTEVAGPKGEGERLMVQVQFKLPKWDFANGATGSDELARMKELAVEVKMVYLVVAKEV